MGDALDSLIARLRGLNTFATDVAKRAAPAIERAVRAQAAKGIDPNGRAWAPKKDGGQPLKNASSEIAATPIGNAVAVAIAGPLVFHNAGTGHVPQRQVLPDGPAPQYILDAIKEASAAEFEKVTGGS
jgi:hypothetical protein